MKLAQSLMARFSTNNATPDFDAFSDRLQRLGKKQPRETRFKQLFKNRQSPLAA